MRKLRALLFVGLIGVLGATGCVKPKTSAEIQKLTVLVETLDTQISDLEKRHKAGQLSTKEFISQVTPLFSQVLGARTQLGAVMKKAEEEGSSKWGVWGMIAMNLAAVIAGRVLGIPGLASSSGGNLLNMGKRIISTKTGNPA